MAHEFGVRDTRLLSSAWHSYEALQALCSPVPAAPSCNLVYLERLRPSGLWGGSDGGDGGFRRVDGEY